jgi:hypothetical protein
VKIEHHELKIEFPDEWWAEAGMADFVPPTRRYRTIADSKILTVSIQDVGPVDDTRRQIFRDKADVLKILRGFRLGDAIPPVEVVDGKPDYGHPYKLIDGTHRFYCSLRAGFTHVPAIRKDFDFNDPTA